MNNTFIILAAGSGSRYKSKIPKQFTQYKGKMMLEHSIYKAIDSKLFNRVILVIKKSHKKYLSSIDKSIFGTGKFFKEQTINEKQNNIYKDIDEAIKKAPENDK